MDPIPTTPISSTLMPRHNGSIVKQIDQFMYLRESFEAVLKEHEIDPIGYNEAVSDVDAYLWQKAMEVELEFL